MFKIKNINAGLVLFEKINNEYYGLLGSYFDKNNDVIYTFPGGGYLDSYDKTALHTAVREFIEEIFNIKVADTKLNEIVSMIRKEKLLSNIYIHKPDKFITYFGNFNILNFIYENIYNHKINLYNFINFRNKKVNEKIVPKDGLNEFNKIHVIKINYLLKDKIKIRIISKYILNKMIQLFNIN